MEPARMRARWLVLDFIMVLVLDFIVVEGWGSGDSGLKFSFVRVKDESLRRRAGRDFVRPGKGLRGLEKGRAVPEQSPCGRDRSGCRRLRHGGVVKMMMGSSRGDVIDGLNIISAPRER